MLPSNSRYAVSSAGVAAKHQAREGHAELNSKRRVDPATSVRNDCGEFTFLPNLDSKGAGNRVDSERATGGHLDRPVRAQEAALQTELIHNLRARSVPYPGTLGEDHFGVLDRRWELGAAVVMEF
jgi:hypothetical protein